MAMAVALLTGTLVHPAAAQVEVTDLRGRVVRLDGPARRLVIDDGRFLTALALIHPDPAAVLAAWPKDTNRIGSQAWQGLRTRYPRLATLPAVPSSATPFSVERVLAVRPDVAVLSHGQGPSPAELARLESAGIKVVFIDFFDRPLERVDPSLLILGEVVGAGPKARELVEFRRQHLDRIRRTLAANPDRRRPVVFLEAHAGISAECCNSPGKGNVGDYIELAGGHNIGADVLPGSSGRINLEYVISRAPEVYIGTGGPHLAKSGGLVIGPESSAAATTAALGRLMNRPGFQAIKAIRDRRVHALSHQLLNSPLDLLAAEALAVWINPELFGDLDPAATMTELNRRFLPVPMSGTWWLKLDR